MRSNLKIEAADGIRPSRGVTEIMACWSLRWKIYWGTLPTGQVVAIKRAQKESKRGAQEFKAEIELLSWVHHKWPPLWVSAPNEKNKCSVYEYIRNGTLKDAFKCKGASEAKVVKWCLDAKVYNVLLASV
ncbi:hypothetical protein ACSQ67_005784 [Phaseolus vulgaris]